MAFYYPAFLLFLLLMRRSFEDGEEEEKMSYIAKNIDTEKALEALESARHIQEQYEHEEQVKMQAHYDGVRKGLEIAESVFHCTNYEKPPAKEVNEDAVYAQAVNDTIYELCKELDIASQDIRDNEELSLDEKCAAIADRVKAAYGSGKTWEGGQNG